MTLYTRPTPRKKQILPPSWSAKNRIVREYLQGDLTADAAADVYRINPAYLAAAQVLEAAYSRFEEGLGVALKLRALIDKLKSPVFSA